MYTYHKTLKIDPWAYISQRAFFPGDTRRRFNVCKTPMRRRKRLIDVETMSCVYWIGRYQKLILYVSMWKLWNFHCIAFWNSNHTTNESNEVYKSKLNTLTLSCWRPLSYRNQYNDLVRKSMDWFLYDNGLRHERVKEKKIFVEFIF